MALPRYATREDVKDALDYKETARNNGQVDRAVDAATRTVEALCHRRFYPELGTRYFDWPNPQRAWPWRLWLDDNELISVTTLSSGGTTIPPTDYWLRRSDNRDEAPYTYLELNLSTTSAFGGGATWQRDITITGLWGYTNNETSAGATVEALDASETGVDVDGPASTALGVGSVLRVDDERMIVTGRAQLDTGQTLAADIDAQAKTVTVAVQSGAAFAVGESILIDSERMRIEDIAGNALTVKRAWDGSVLAAHTAAVHIYAPRTLTVERGALGTTAATHLTAAAVYRWDPPAPVRTLAVAEAVSTLLQEASGYARTRRTGDGGEKPISMAGLAGLREQAYTSHGRKARSRAV